MNKGTFYFLCKPHYLYYLKKKIVSSFSYIEVFYFAYNTVWLLYSIILMYMNPDGDLCFCE